MRYCLCSNPSSKVGSFMRSRGKRRLADAKSRRRRTYSILKMGNKVIPVLLFLQASERHLSTGDILNREDVGSALKRWC